jgi:transposase-like protein
MIWILSDIISLMQYVMAFEEKEYSRKEICVHCGKTGLWCHGHYGRKADRLANTSESLNPVLIQRYYCPSCGKTCSALPECLPPRRWYLWEIQQMALMLLLTGKSLRAIAQEIVPSRRTIGRWAIRFKEQFLLHKNTLCNHIIDLGRTTGFTDFWQACLGQISLAQAMRLCHVAGVTVP